MPFPATVPAAGTLRVEQGRRFKAEAPNKWAYEGMPHYAFWQMPSQTGGLVYISSPDIPRSRIILRAAWKCLLGESVIGLIIGDRTGTTHALSNTNTTGQGNIQWGNSGVQTGNWASWRAFSGMGGLPIHRDADSGYRPAANELHFTEANAIKMSNKTLITVRTNMLTTDNSVVECTATFHVGFPITSIASIGLTSSRANLTATYHVTWW